jgi:hypothetical protein
LDVGHLAQVYAHVQEEDAKVVEAEEVVDVEEEEEVVAVEEAEEVVDVEEEVAEVLFLKNY